MSNRVAGGTRRKWVITLLSGRGGLTGKRGRLLPDSEVAGLIDFSTVEIKKQKNDSL